MQERTTEARREAQIIETDDGMELRPPVAEVEGDVPSDIVEAVNSALEQAPNACIDPRVVEDDLGGYQEAILSANYQEQPVTDDDGGLVGWVAPYRAREDITEALMDELPEDVSIEAINNRETGFYRRDR